MSRGAGRPEPRRQGGQKEPAQIWVSSVFSTGLWHQTDAAEHAEIRAAGSSCNQTVNGKLAQKALRSLSLHAESLGSPSPPIPLYHALKRPFVCRSKDKRALGSSCGRLRLNKSLSALGLWG